MSTDPGAPRATEEPTCPECGGINREYEHRLACSRGLSPMHRQAERQYPEILRSNREALQERARKRADDHR